jgi:hypothetical protein
MKDMGMFYGNNRVIQNQQKKASTSALFPMKKRGPDPSYQSTYG